MRLLLIAPLILSCLFLSATPTPVQAKKPLLQHGVKYQKVDDIAKYYVSEKLDGIRGYWDGKQLFTRQGNLLSPPNWFTKNWPNTPLDGELWIARRKFEQVSSIIRSKHADEEWQAIKFMLFDINQQQGTFAERVTLMKQLVEQTQSPYLQLIPQVKFEKISLMMQQLEQVIANGGEGLMLHHQDAHYQVGRNKQLMKLKKLYDAEARVTGYIAGKGKFKGLLGALKVKTEQGISFNIGSGFSLEQRQHPPKIGSLITYQYFGKTRYGVPRFASFVRIRPEF